MFSESTMGFNHQAKILIVDDSSTHRFFLKGVLSTLDVEIYSVASGDEALELTSNHDFSVFLLDIEMPVMDGYELAEKFGDQINTKHVPIIFISGIEQNKKSILKGYDAGAIDFLLKPVQKEILLFKVKVILNLDHQHKELAYQQNKTELTLGAIPDPIISLKNDVIHYMNNPAKSLARLFGHETSCSTLTEMFAFDSFNSKKLQHYVAVTLREDLNEMASIELTFRHPVTRNHLIYEVKAILAKDLENVMSELIIVFTDITQIRALSKKLSFQASHDSLTDLPNRRALAINYKKAYIRKKRTNKNIAIMLIDLDDFKLVNDTSGHHAGDLALRVSTERIVSCLRESDVLHRIGGDEFCVLIEDFDNVDELILPAKRIIDVLNEKIVVDEKEHFLGASIGIASTLISNSATHSELLSDADMAMYEAKNLGKNQAVFFNDEIRSKIHYKANLDSDLRLALIEDEFVLHYQPQISVSSGEITGIEALIRWKKADGKLISPLEFLPSLEDTGFIKEVGKWVVEKACSDIARWGKSNLKVPCVSVNVSPKQFEQDDITHFIIQTIAEFKIPPACFGIEITESLFMESNSSIESDLNLLHDSGCKISLDDFGTGYSSLSYLMRFPIDKLKIDKSFILELDKNPKHQILVKSLVALSHELNSMEVISEGVEQFEVLDTLLEMKCDTYQGYLYSKPVTFDEITQMLTRN